MVGATIGYLVRPALERTFRTRAVGQTVQPLNPGYFEARRAQYAATDSSIRPGAIVWLGDSITDWICIDEMIESESLQLVNRGISGDTTSGVLSRIEKSFPPDASACILMIGHNDLAKGGTPAEAVARIVAICENLTQKGKVPYVLVHAVLPSFQIADGVRSDFNARLKAAVFGLRSRGVEWADLSGDFGGTAPDPRLYVDGVHLNLRGARARLSAEIKWLSRFEAGQGLRLRPESR